MCTVPVLNTAAKGVEKAFRKGRSVFILFLFLGVIGFLLLDAAAAHSSMYFSTLSGFTVLWAGASMVALNMLIGKARTPDRIMYTSDYTGLFRTTMRFLVGGLLVDVLFLLFSALFWLPFVFGNTNPVLTLLSGTYTLSLSAWYMLLVQSASAFATLYLVSRVVLFPVFIAVDNKPIKAALNASWEHTSKYALRISLLLVFASITALGALYAGVYGEGRIAAVLAQQGLTAYPYVETVGRGIAFTGFLAAGTLLKLGVISAVYDRLTE